MVFDECLQGIVTVDDEDTPRPSRASSAARSVSGSSHGEKVTLSTFSPMTTRLAGQAKSTLCELVAIDHTFPSNKDVFVWDAVKKAAQSENTFKSAIQRAIKNLDTKAALIDYVSVSVCFIL